MNPSNPDKPLIPYIRQSRAKEKTISLDEQRRAIQVWAKQAGVMLADEVVEQGVSGSKPWRERELGEVVKACEAGKAAGVVVAYQDRLSRENGLGTAEVWEALKSASARLVCAAEGLDTGTGQGMDDDIDQEMLFSIKAAIARQQWRRFRANWNNAKRAALARGVKVGVAPAGYRKLADGTLAKNEDAEKIRQAYRVRARGGSWSEVARALEGVTTRQVLHAGTDRERVRTNGGRWTITGARSLIQSPIYKGLLKCGEHERQLPGLAVVSAPTWERAQPSRGAGYGRKDGGKALLAGILHCAGCRRALAASTTVRASKTYRYYRCVCGRQFCPAPGSVRDEEIEALVVRDALDAIAYRPLAPAPPDLSPLERAVEDAQASEEQWKAKAIAGESPEVAIPAYEAAKARRAEAEKALEEAIEAAGLNDERLTLAERWPELSVPERRRTLQAFGVEASVQRGREPLAQRVTLLIKTVRYREAATGGDFEPEVVIEGLPSEGKGTVWDNPDETARAFEAVSVEERLAPLAGKTLTA